MPEHPDAAQRIRAWLVAGMLPPADIKRVVVLRGSGRPCDACQALILAVERRAVVDCVGSATGLNMHVTCVAIWQYQSTRAT